MSTIAALHLLVATLLVIGVLALCGAILLLLAAARFPPDTQSLIEAIQLRLPQTQCGQCGYPGCRPYAQALAAGEAINKCPPGGARLIGALADLLNVEVLALDPAHGVEKPREIAFIREEECIGCVKCIAACPVDAILGAPGQMHTVIAAECTGCDLCVQPCPVDCIEMRVLPATQTGHAPRARQRFEARQQRLREEQARAAAQRLERQSSAARGRVEARRARVEAAVARVRARTLQDPALQGAAVAAAVERARGRALARVATMTVTDAPAPAAATRPSLERRIATTERKLQRARRKHAEARAAADDETRRLLAGAITRLEERLAKARHDLDCLPGERA